MRIGPQITGQLASMLTPAAVALPGAVVPKRSQEATNTGVTVGSTPNKGSYVTIVDPIADDCYALWVDFIDGNVGNRDHFFDLALGAAGSEVIIVPNLHRSLGSSIVWNTATILPIFIPKGVRLAARASSSASGLTPAITLREMLTDPLFGPPRLRQAEDWGTFGSGTTRLQSIDPGGSANTKGSWTQLIASTARRVRSVVVQTGNQRNTTRTACFWQIDIGVGGAGSEVVTIPDLFCVDISTQHGGYPEHFGPFPVDIPAGSRISARAQCSITDATDRLIDVSALGFSE